MGKSRTSPQPRPCGTPAPWLAPPSRTPPPSTTAPSPSHLTQRTRRKKTGPSASSWQEGVIKVSATNIRPSVPKYYYPRSLKIFWNILYICNKFFQCQVSDVRGSDNCNVLLIIPESMKKPLIFDGHHSGQKISSPVCLLSFVSQLTRRRNVQKFPCPLISNTPSMLALTQSRESLL